MIRREWIILLLLSLLYRSDIGYTETSKSWRFWTEEDGLIESYSRSVTTSSDGAVWIVHGEVDKATWLDGYEIRHFGAPDYATPVHHAYGQIWSTYWKKHMRFLGGLQQYVDDHWIRYEIEEFAQIQFKDDPFYPFLPIADNRILFVLKDRIMVFDATTRRTEEILSVHNTRLGQFHDLCGSQHGIWITGKKGALLLHETNGSIYSTSEWREFILDDEYKIQNLWFPFEIQNTGLFASAEFVTNSDSVFLCLKDGEWEIRYSTDEQNAIGIPGLDNSLWVRKINDSIFSLSQLKNAFEHPVERNRIFSTKTYGHANQENGVLWLTTGNGVARYTPLTWRTPQDVTDIQTICHSIYEDLDGRIWFCCQTDLVLFDHGVWKRYSMPEQSFWYAVAGMGALPDGRIVIHPTPSSGYDLLFFDPIKERFELFNDPEERLLQYIKPRKDNTIWVQSHLGNCTRLEIFDGKSFQTVIEKENWGLSDYGHITTILEAEDGTLWLGGNTGLAWIRDGNYYRFEQDIEYPGDGSFAFLDQGDGKIWICSRDQIIEYDKENFTSISEGLGRITHCISAKDQSVWVASEKGVFRFFHNSWVLNTSLDGLPDAGVWTIFQDSQERIWVGTTQGISRYHPEADCDPPRTRLNSDENNTEIGPRSRAQFIFSGNDRWKVTPTIRLLYSYRIDEEEWTPFQKQTVASLSNLIPGQHTFQVRAMDRNWNIDPKPASLDFTVLAPWYRQIGFLICITIGFIIVIIAISFAVSRHVNLERLVSQRTWQLRSLTSEMSFLEERERRQFASDLHDCIGHSLIACRMQLDRLESKLTDQNPTLEFVVKINNLVQEAIQNTRTLTFEISPTILYKLGLVPALEWLIEQFQKNHGLTVFFRDDGLDKPLNSDSKGFLFRSIREILFNVVKHAKINQATLIVKKEGNQIVVEISDEGIGFDVSRNKKSQASGYGLYSINERIEWLEGSMKIDSSPKSGTRIQLSIPLKRNQNDENNCFTR